MLTRRSNALAFAWRCCLEALGVLLIVAAVLCAASARGEADVAAAAPWQVPPEARASSSRATLNSDDAVPSASSDSDCGDDCGGYDCRPCFQSCGDWFWFRGDYLMWWGKSAHLPALAANDLAGTSTIFGDQSVDQGLRSGARLTLGAWLTPCQDSGIEFTYLFLGDSTAAFTQSSTENPILTRPFFNAETFAASSVVLGNPGRQTGSITTGISNELQSFEAVYRQVMCKWCDNQIDGLVGYRYGRLSEGLSIDATTTIVNNVPPFANGTVIAVSDLFDTINEFHGGELGISAKNRYCRWTLEVLGKLALGSTRSRLTVNGSTTTTPPTGTPVVTTGGFLAQGTNSSQAVPFEQTGFAVMPELGVNISYDLTCRLKATCGYSFLYWSRVVRPADQIDTNLNPTQFSGGTLSGFPAPEHKFVVSDYWAQGLNLGLEYKF